MDLQTEILEYLRDQYQEATGNVMVPDNTMKSSMAPFYCKDLKDNLIEPMDAKALDEYNNGDGSELEEKMRALRSSSALTYNLLGNKEIEVRADSNIFIPGTYQITYEWQFDTIRNNPHKANLDAYLEGSDQLIFCEMKMLEWLFNKPGALRVPYLDRNLYLNLDIYEAAKECVDNLMESFSADKRSCLSSLSQYDAFQMFKHTLAIYNYVSECRNEQKSIPSNIRLVNCVWHLPEDVKLLEKATWEYLGKEKTEHKEFEIFYKAAEKMRLKFTDLGIDFDILMVSAADFVKQFVKTPEELQYLKRYFGEHEGKRTDNSVIFNNILDEMSNDTMFYRAHALNYTGMAGGQYYTEMIAEMLYEECHRHDGNLSELLLKNSNLQYEKEFPAGPIHSKDGKKIKLEYNPNSNRDEENIAKRLFEMNLLDIIGFEGAEIVDYQVPVNRVNHSGEGKNDLIFSTQCQTLVGELKDPDSKETLLRAVVEAETYREKVLKNPTAKCRFEKCYHHETIMPAVLFFAGEKSQLWKDYQMMMDGKMPFLRKLLSALDMLLFLVEPEEEYDDTVPYGERKYRIRRLSYIE